jgi:hypothetical protein
MNTISSEIISYRLEALKEKVAELAKVAKKLDAPLPEVVVTDRIEKTVHNQDTGEDIIEVWFAVDILNAQPVLDGGWQFVASVQHIIDDVALVFTHPDFRDLDLSQYKESASKCDHCKQTRHRKATYIFRSEDDALVQVGSTCMTDFIGHQLKFRWYELLTDLLDEPRENRYGTSAYRPSVPEILRACGLLVNNLGFNKASSETPTKTLIGACLGHRERWVQNLTPMTPEQVQELNDATQWALTQTDDDSDYLRSLRIIIEHDLGETKYYGILASLLTSYRRHMGWLVERELRATLPTAPVIEGKIQITGKVIGKDIKDYEQYTRYVMTVLDDRGFKVWGTIPSAIHGVIVGDRITFSATVEKSSQDETFGFYSRPTKAKVIEAVELNAS